MVRQSNRRAGWARRPTKDPAADPTGYRPITDYALIGDGRTAALVASTGAIDWLCLPSFDSPAVLCRLLDAERGGHLMVGPATPVVASRRQYRASSAVLETTYMTRAGTLRVTDAMPFGHETAGSDGSESGSVAAPPRVIRLLEVSDGPIDVVLSARLSFDFAATSATIQLIPEQGAIAHDGGERYLALIWPGELRQSADGELRGSLALEPGRSAVCVLAFTDNLHEARSVLDEESWVGPVRATEAVWRSWAEQVAATDAGWRWWAGCCTATGPYRDLLLRSALTLRLLLYEPTGALVAAPTTSLPEAIGGVRNWDYRYCWLRDATLTLYALCLAGDHAAMRAFWHWVESTFADKPPHQLQIMYGLRGERVPPERALDHLAGYRGSRPVRVGNAASHQQQLDVFGEILDAAWFYHHHAQENGQPPTLRPRLWSFLRAIANHICDVWREPDQGLWEVRSEPRHFVHSKVMCWVGLDRAVKLATATGLPGEVTSWTAERDRIHADVIAHGYRATGGAFTMAYGTDELDAAILQLPLVGFLPATDPRMRSTIERIHTDLGANGLLMRYLAGDGLPGTEGAFLLCSFWLVECLIALGRLDEARTLFERLLAYGNDVGLFAEEVDPATGTALGNYPQAFTHLAVLGTGIALTEALACRAPIAGDATARARVVCASQEQRGIRQGMRSV